MSIVSSLTDDFAKSYKAKGPRQILAGNWAYKSDIHQIKTSSIKPIEVARRLGRFASILMRFFFLARQKMRLSHESDLKLNRALLQKLFGEKCRKHGAHHLGFFGRNFEPFPSQFNRPRSSQTLDRFLGLSLGAVSGHRIAF